MNPKKLMEILKENGLKTCVKYVLASRVSPAFLKTIQDHYYDLPIDENKILLLGLGKSVRGNLQYILNELNLNPEYERFQIYVRTTKETEPVVNEFIRAGGWTRTHPVTDDYEYGIHMETAKFLLTEVYFPKEWIHKDGQVVINIWHGTPLKRLGLEKMEPDKYGAGVTQKNFINADYLLYPNEFTKKTMLDSYRVAGLMQGQALLLGYPRTSGLCDRSHVEEDRRMLAPGGEHFYAYMPTWKEYLSTQEMLDDTRKLLDYLDAHLGDGELLYVNLHHKVSDQLDYSSFKKIRKFPADLDSYRLLAASDGLITDYSSVFFDYLASRKNIILYVPDLETYVEKRGTYMDISRLPFHKVTTPQAVLEAMRSGKTYDDSEAYREFCSHEHESNAAELCRIFLGDTSGLTLEKISSDSRKKVLWYSDQPDRGNCENFYLSYVQEHDRKNIDLYVSGFTPLMRNERARMMNAILKVRDEQVFGMRPPHRNSNFSSRGLYTKTKYNSRRMTFDEAAPVLMKDYATVWRMTFGISPFDLVVLDAVTNTDRMLTLASAPCRVLVFLSGHILSAQKRGDRQLIDAVNCLIRSGCTFAAQSEETVEKAKQLFPALHAQEAVLIRSAAEMDAWIKAQ